MIYILSRTLVLTVSGTSYSGVFSYCKVFYRMTSHIAGYSGLIGVVMTNHLCPSSPINRIKDFCINVNTRLINCLLCCFGSRL